MFEILLIITAIMAFIFGFFYLLGWWVEKRKPHLYQAAKQYRQSKKKRK